MHYSFQSLYSQSYHISPVLQGFSICHAFRLSILSLGDNSAASLLSVPAGVPGGQAVGQAGGLAGGQAGGLVLHQAIVHDAPIITPVRESPAKSLGIISQNLELQPGAPNPHQTHHHHHHEDLPSLPQYVSPPAHDPHHGYHYPPPDKEYHPPTPDYAAKRKSLPSSRIQFIISQDDKPMYKQNKISYETEDIRKHMNHHHERIFLKAVDIKNPPSNYLAAFAAVYGDEDGNNLRANRDVDNSQTPYRSPLALGHLAAYH